MTPIRRRHMMTTVANATGHVGLRPRIDSFLDGYRAAGYGPAAVTSRRVILNAFVRSIASTHRATEDLSDADVTAFLHRPSHGREDPKERAVLRRFLTLRIPHACGAIPSPARSSSFDSLMRQMIFH
jgi:hypothetical protein